MIYEGRVTDLSEKGVFVKTNLQFPLNSVFLLMTLHNKHVFKSPARVVRFVNNKEQNDEDSGNGMGLEFINPASDYLEFVKQYRVDSSL